MVNDVASLRSLTVRAGAALCLCGALAGSACRRTEPAPPAPAGPQVSGTLRLSGLRGDVHVDRDPFGIPHITAANTDDLFFAQGFVQAQDRLFQMDLWKRAAQGRLAEVMGANFIQRDSMTRRIQFRGDFEREWQSYGPDTRRIAVAFTNGINEWVRLARQQRPEEFVLAGWEPELWKPEDLLNRTDTYLASSAALDDLVRARLVATLGPARVDQLLPPQRGLHTTRDLGVDLSVVTFVVSDALRRIGTPPFFLTLAGPVSETARRGQRTPDVQLTADADSPFGGGAAAVPSRAPRPGAGRTWLVDAAHSASGKPLLAVAENDRLENPSRRYLVQLTAPGWNVAGATSPWMPGVAIGHNDRIAWAYTASDDDTQDVFVERTNPDNPHQVARDGRWVDMQVDRERLSVKGRTAPVEYERLYTPNGVVIAQDREHALVYTLRWTGTEYGGTAELASLGIARAESWPDFRTALARWEAPAAEFVYADVDGRVARQRAGLVPIRPAGAGLLPSAGWLAARGWQGFTDLSLETDTTESAGSSEGTVSAADLQRAQLDIHSRNASALIARLEKIGVVPREIEAVRPGLVAWDRMVRANSKEASLYRAWERAIRQRLAARLVQAELVQEFALRLDPVALLNGPVSSGAGGDIGPWRDILLVDALSDALNAPVGQADSRAHFTFPHPLAVFNDARRRFDVHGYPLHGHTDTVFSTDGVRGPVLQAVFDLSDWSRTAVTNPPGQAGSPSNPHYDDLAPKWAAGEYVNLLFAQSSVPSLQTSGLTLQPR